MRLQQPADHGLDWQHQLRVEPCQIVGLPDMLCWEEFQLYAEVGAA